MSSSVAALMTAPLMDSLSAMDLADDSNSSTSFGESLNHHQLGGAGPMMSAVQLNNAREVGKASAHRMWQLREHTQLSRPRSDILPLQWADVSVEDLLGVGGFGCVCLATVPKLSKAGKHRKVDAGSAAFSYESMLSDSMYSAATPSSHVDMSDSMSMFSEANENDDETDVASYFAVKCLNQKTMQTREEFIMGARDLAGEAFLLSRISHPNIVRLRGLSGGNIEDAYLKKGGYFIVLDVLNSTLFDMLNDWKKEKSERAAMRDLFRLRSHGSHSSSSSIPSLESRLANIAVGITKGMEYLHENRVVVSSELLHSLHIIMNVWFRSKHEHIDVNTIQVEFVQRV